MSDHPSRRYQHCSEKDPHRYLAECDFRYSNRSATGVEDGERANLAVKGASGKTSGRIVNLTKPDFKRQAWRFLKWRTKKHPPKQPIRGQVLANALVVHNAHKP